VTGILDILKQELQELEKIVTLREKNELLMDTLVNLLTRTTYFCHQNGIPIENEMAIRTMLSETRKLLHDIQIPTRNQQHFKHQDDSTEPIFCHFS
jgi:hypothetical protein